MSFQLPKSARPFQSAFEVDVTPELAILWLKANGFNRDINPPVVYQYCNQMLAGRWRRTHQGLAFDTNGTLLDGQHRLLAVCMSKKTVPMMISINEAGENFEVIDSGKKRTNLDVLQMKVRNSSLSGSVITTLRAMVAGRYCNTLNISSAEVDEFYDMFHEGVDFAVSLFEPLKVSGRLNDTTMRGVVARAYYTMPVEKLTRFGEIYCLGEAHPLVTPFRDWLLTLRNHRENTRREIYKRCQYMLLAFSQDKDTVEYPAQVREIFQLPK